YSTVVVCPHKGCKWRDITTDRARAWYTLARHLKAAHRDRHAANNARKNAWHLMKSSDHDD
ncbi:hypothetical protein, partial [Corynebacterium sanguinis]|uniref:hypothetical protein n=1 Tax=Corynebacterium sanguinis TaxID=2594913 RepID=UPI001C693E7C